MGARHENQSEDIHDAIEGRASPSDTPGHDSRFFFCGGQAISPGRSTTPYLGSYAALDTPGHDIGVCFGAQRSESALKIQY